MSEIINLRRARRQRARQDKRRQADANAAQHGIGKAARKAASRAKQRRTAYLDGHRADRSIDDE